MIKEYEEVKKCADSYVSSRNLDAAVVVDEIYIEEYNALDIRIIGKNKSFDNLFLDLQAHMRRNHSKIVDTFEMISGITPNQVSILVYLKPVLEIRHNKIIKIKSKILM
jgi:hypothetical protein